MEEADTHPSSSTNPTPSNPMPSDETIRKSQEPRIPSLQSSPNADFQMFPIMYPSLVPGLVPLPNPEQNDRGPGIYAVPFAPFMGPMTGFPPNTLIPLTYNIPTRANSAGVVGEEHGQEARQQQRPEREVVVRRFQFAVQLDLLLIIKLAAVVFLFNQDGSRHRLILLLLFASLVYLYQTGALTPFMRWLRRGALPPPRPVVRPENGPPIGHNDGNDPRPEENSGVENQNQPAETDPQVVNENQPEPERGDGNWWGIAKEIQMFVVGFITSLLPGFHHHND